MDTHVTGKCPQCGADFRLRAHAAGRRAKCKTCQRIFVVPGPRKPAPNEEDVMTWLDRPAKQEADEAQIAFEDDEDEEEADDEDPDMLTSTTKDAEAS